MEIRRARAIKGVDGLFVEGSVWTEYCDSTGMFYPDTMTDVVGTGIQIETIAENHGGFDKYWVWIEPICHRDSLYYQQNSKKWGDVVATNRELAAYHTHKAEKYEALL